MRVATSRLVNELTRAQTIPVERERTARKAPISQVLKRMFSQTSNTSGTICAMVDRTNKFRSDLYDLAQNALDEGVRRDNLIFYLREIADFEERVWNAQSKDPRFDYVRGGLDPNLVVETARAQPAQEVEKRKASEEKLSEYEYKTLLYDFIHDPNSPLRRPHFWFYVAVVVYGIYGVMSWLR